MTQRVSRSAACWLACVAFLTPAGMAVAATSAQPQKAHAPTPHQANQTTSIPGRALPPWGACCVMHECTVTTEAECLSIGGIFLGQDTTCDGNPCHPNTGENCGHARPAIEGPNVFTTENGSDSGFGEPDESICENTYLDWSGSNDFWFHWTSPGTGLLNLDTCDENSYDTSMVVYEGADCASIIQIACNGDAEENIDDCQNYYSTLIDLNVSSGQTYWIRIGGWNGDSGPGTLNLTYSGSNDPIGACCLDGECLELTESGCLLISGQYAGNNILCADAPCVPGATACCIDATCHFITAEDCADMGGVSLPSDTDCSQSPCGFAGELVGIHWHVIGTDLVEGESTYTVDVYLDTPDGARLDAVAGNSLQSKTIASSSTFYQDPLGGPTSLDINPAMYPLAPNLEFDSRVTIGALDQTGDPFDDNALNVIGIDWTSFENGGLLSVSDGTWFILPVDAQGVPQPFVDETCASREGVLIARLTTTDHASQILFSALFQGRDSADNLWQDATSRMIAYQGEQDCNGNRLADACDIAAGTSEDADQNGIPDECETGCQWDLDGNGNVDVNDLLALINEFGATYHVNDLLALIAEFGCGG
ncbi:MAG: hypothetical protein MK100_04850 [Phycisphaerales bacterium]|nr:hypothetical protein [Phycisphaerales bacterium]